MYVPTDCLLMRVMVWVQNLLDGESSKFESASEWKPFLPLNRGTIFIYHNKSNPQKGEVINTKTKRTKDLRYCFACHLNLSRLQQLEKKELTFKNSSYVLTSSLS
jgi:hypothetical protein